jgi:DNA ligase-1
MLKWLSLEETPSAVYLSLGFLEPPFRSLQFQVAEKMLIKAISIAFNKDQSHVVEMGKKEGDLGFVAEELSLEDGESDISVAEVYSLLTAIAWESGAGSQDRKIAKIASLYKKCNPISNRYISRIILGTMRLGFSDITVIEALSWLLAGDKSLKGKIEEKYRIYPDIGFIAKNIKENGIEGLKKIKITPSVPVLPAKCARVATAEEALEKIKGEALVEDKFDGTRVQIHLDKTRKKSETLNSKIELFSSESTSTRSVWTFTRNLEESTHQFPDLVDVVLKNVKAETAILDAEAIGYNPKSGEFIPFQETIKRKRKHDIAEISREIPLTLRVFDILYLDGKSLIDLPFSERREILINMVTPTRKIQVAQNVKIPSPEKLLEVFEDAVGRGLEGIVIKDSTAKYPVGNRGFAWIKFKREETDDLSDTIDAVVLGYYSGTGKRTDFGIGAFLIGVYDEKTDSYRTLSKIGTGLTDKEWSEIKEKCDKVKVLSLPSNVLVPSELKCDVFCQPKIVVVIRADNITISPLHSAKFALRFPRLVSYRTDKGPKEATTVSEISTLFKNQKKI